MRKLKTRIGDLMSTQTGGKGETIQAQPEIQTLPEEFSKDVSAPEQEPVVTPTDIKPVEGPQQQSMPIEPTAMLVDDSEQIADQEVLDTKSIIEEKERAKEDEAPIWPPQGSETIVEDTTLETQTPVNIQLNPSSSPMSILNDDGTEEDILSNSYETSLNILQSPNINPNGTPIILGEQQDQGEPVFFSQQDIDDYERKQTLNEFGESVVNYIDEVDKKNQQKEDQIKRNNEILKGDVPSKTTFDQIAKSVQLNQYSSSYNDDPVYASTKYGPSANMNTFLNVFDLDSEEIINIAKSSAASTGKEAIQEYADYTTAYASQLNYVNDLEEILKTGVSKSDIVLNKNTTDSGVVLDEQIVKGKPLNQNQKQAISKQLEWAKKQSEILKGTIDNYKFETKIDPKTLALEPNLDVYAQFEKQTNSKLRDVWSTKWKVVETKGTPYEEKFNGQKVYVLPNFKKFSDQSRMFFTSAEAKEYKAYAKWVDTDGRKLIKEDIKNGTSKYFNAEKAFGYDATKYPAIQELRNDIYEVEMHNNYVKTGTIDNFTYSGFKATAERLSKENNKAVNDAISDVAEKVLMNGKQEEQQWIADNKKILMTQISDVKSQMDDLLQSRLQKELSSNFEASDIVNFYSQKINATEDSKEKSKLNNEMMTALKKYPTIANTMNEYNSALQKFVSNAQSIYTQSYANFKQDLYDKSVDDIKNGLVTTLRNVYRSGVNNDINTYEFANKIVKSDEFKQASFYTKRKIISDAWDDEKNRITAMVKSGKLRYPKTNEEAGKHWSEWTGVRTMTAEEKKKWTEELPKRTGSDAKSRFIFYAVDELLYNKKGKPSVYAIQSFAREQLTELQDKKKSLGIKSDEDLKNAIFQSGRGQEFENRFPVSPDELSKLNITEEYLKKIINTPETDQGFWSELGRGFVDGFEIPFIGSLMNIGKNYKLMNAVDNYMKDGMDLYDLSLVNAYASLNKLAEIRPNTTSYNIGSGLGFTTTFMLEMMATGGLNSVGQGIGKGIVSGIENILKSSVDDAVKASVTAASESPLFIERVKNVVGFMTGGMLEGAVNPQAYKMSLDRMIDRVSVQESGAYDNVIAIIDRNSGEGAFEAFTKGYSNWLGMSVIERLGGHLVKGKLTKDAAQYMGTSTFMKRTIVGKLMRDYGFKSVDEAATYMANNKMPWSGFLPEMMEEVLQGGWEALITGDSPVFGTDDNGDMNYLGMTADELKTTAAVVAIFGGVMAAPKTIKAVVSKENNVSIETKDTDGNTFITDMSKDTWNKYNSMMADQNLTWRSVAQIMSEDESLTPEQSITIANVLIQMRGKEILDDENYKNWKKDRSSIIAERQKAREAQVEETKKQILDILTEDQKQRLQETEVAQEYGLGPDTAEETVDPKENDIDNQMSLISENEDVLSNPDITVVSVDENGQEVETNLSDNADKILEGKKNRKLTRGAGRAGRQVAKQKGKAAKEEGIQFEMPKAEGAVTEEVPVTESTITTPIDLTDDTENITGVPSQVAEGAQPVETQPVAEAGQETPGVSGVVQEEQVQTEVIPTEEKGLEKTVQDTTENETRRIEDLSVEEYVTEDLPLISYEGQDELTKNQVDAYNEKSRKVNEDGSFSDKYGRSIIEYLATILPDRKLISAFRRAGLDIPQSYDISPDYRRGMGVSGYIRENIGLIANGYDLLSESEKIQATKILSNAAENAGIKVATLESEANREVIKPSVETAPAQTTTEKQFEAVGPYFVSLEDNGKWKLYNSNKQSLGLTYNSKEEAVDAYNKELELEKAKAATEEEVVVPKKRPRKATTQTGIDAINTRINEIYDNGEEDTKKGKQELEILQERLKELENQSKEERAQEIAIDRETAAVKEQPIVEEEEVPNEVQSFRDRLLNLYDSVPESNKKRRTSTKQYISGQQNSVNPIEREAATLALNEIERREKEQAQTKKAPRKKAAEGPKEKTDSDGFVSVESSSRGVQNKPEYDEKGNLKAQGFYSVKISEDGTKADVKDPLGNINPKVKISTTESGDRYVVSNGNMVYVDRTVMSSKPVAVQETTTEEKTGTYKKRVSSFYEPGKKTVKEGMAPSEINKLKAEAEALKKDPNYANNKKSINRVKEIEDIIDSNKGKISSKAAELEKNLQYDPKSEDFNSPDPRKAGIVDPLGKPWGKQINEARDKKQITEEEYKALTEFYEQKKTDYYNNRAKSKEQRDAENLSDRASQEIDNLINSGEATTEEIEALQDDSAQVAAEVALEDTNKEIPKTKKKRSKSATRRRGATIHLTDTLLKNLLKAFPEYIKGIDTTQAGFRSAAQATGRSMNSAAILYNGIVYLNDMVANDNTALEEFAHLYLLVMKVNNKPLYDRGLKLIQQNGIEYINEVISDPDYAYIHENQTWDELTFDNQEEVAFEALSKMIADRGETVLEEKRKSPISTFIKDVWKYIARLFMGWGSRKLNIVKDDINTYTTLIAKELMRGRAISTVSPEMISELMDGKGTLKYVPISRTSVMGFNADWVGYGRRIFAANKGLGDAWSMKLTAPGRKIKALQNSVRLTVEEFNKALNDYAFVYKSRTGNDADLIQLKRDIDEAFKDIDFRNNFFANDALADLLIKPVFTKMRNQVDAMSKELVDSGRFGEELVASINANNEIYLHTNYYIYSKAAENILNKKNAQTWMQYFTEQEKKEIYDWIYDGAYSKAGVINYKINPTNGKITITFENSFGARTQEVTFDTTADLFDYVKNNVNSVVGKIPANISNFTFNSTQGIIDLGPGAWNIENTGLEFYKSTTTIDTIINDMVRNNDKSKLNDFLATQMQILSSGEASITKKKQQKMNETKKMFLMEILDPATNYANTIAKQAGLLYKTEMEQMILDSGFLAYKNNPVPSQVGTGQTNWTKITNPNSRLQGYYIPTEMFETLYSINTLGGNNPQGVTKFAYGASAIMKMAVTTLSMMSNAGNYLSGWFQLAKTGGLPINLYKSGHNAALLAVGTQLDGKAEATSWIFNLLSNTVRHLVTIRNKSQRLGDMNLPLSPVQAARYGTSNWNDLTPRQQAEILSDELVEQGIINTSIEAEALTNLAELAFNDVEIPQQVVERQIKGLSRKAIQGAKRITGKVANASAATYSFSDSMFKAMLYINNKEFNMKTYGEEMRKSGMTAEQIDDAIKQKTAEQVRKQMPTYDRSPDALRWFSKFPILGPFVQFDFQNKINDKNIFLEGSRMMTVDAPRMIKNGMWKEGMQVFAKGSYIMGMAITSQYMSYLLYKWVSGMFGWGDDDDEAFARVQADYRKYNTFLHLDSNKTGLHTYVDINRAMPQALYLKYYRALTRDGVDAFAKSFFEPYMAKDIFWGSAIDTFYGINKYGEFDQNLERKGLVDKLKYMIENRLLPPTAYGQVSKVVRALMGEEAMEGVPANVWNELSNIYLGVKVRTTRLDKDFGSTIKYGDINDIENEKSNLDEAIDARDKRVEQAERGVEAATPEDIEKLNQDVIDEFNKFETFANEKMESLHQLADSFRQLGFTDEQLYKAMIDQKVPKYFARAVLNKTFIPYNEMTGDRIQKKSISGGDRSGRGSSGRGNSGRGNSGRGSSGR